ncbi:MAG: EF-hand domain-containing protein [Burkholderiales bacterium]|nr:EF-hand domain-containing protein [Burkholderiales bacterium]
MKPRFAPSSALLAGFALGLLVVATGVPAQVSERPPPRWTLAELLVAFAQADTDGNGVLSRAEAQQLAILPRTFEEMDQNKDGVLSRAEYEALLRASGQP